MAATLAGLVVVTHLAGIDPVVTEWLALPAVAEELGLDVSRVRRLVAEGQLIAVRPSGGPLQVPAAFVRDRRVLKGLPGTITLLRDAGYRDEEALRWLFTADASLPGRPVDALAENRGTEVRRRAQGLGF